MHAQATMIDARQQDAPSDAIRREHGVSGSSVRYREFASGYSRPVMASCVPAPMTPRVLFVGNFLSSSRASLTVGEALAGRLASAGWTVLATSRRRNRLARLADMVATVWQRRADFDVAVVDVYSGAAFVWAEAVTAALRTVRRPYVLTLHGGNLPAFAATRPNRVRRLLRGARAVTTPSMYLRERMRHLREDLVLVPNAIDLEAYRFRERTKAAPRLVWLRAFHRVYNPVLAIRTVACLREGVPGVHLTMVGSDSGDGAHAAAREAIAGARLGAHVELRAGVPKAAVPSVLDAADIFLNTSTIDNTPVSVMEAMACGLCVVSTSVGGIPFLVDDARDGLLVPSDDAKAMAAAVERILRDPALASSLSRCARAKAEAFDWSAVLPRWESLLEDVAAGGA